MSENKPFLTISLLSSGRSDTIERCLASLAPFKEQLDTEIIVVDTDPEHREDVHAVLKKYADKIIPFEWCDDFATARNAGVDAASGEWFLYIDDDEWFLDAQPLIDFLKSDETTVYDRITHRIRNFGDDEQITYSDSLATRGFKLDGQARFASKVHEYIAPVDSTVKLIEALSGHTGYIFRSEEERRSHAERNVALLEQMRLAEPKQVRWVMQLMAECVGLQDTRREMALAREGYALMDRASGYSRDCIRGLFAANILRLELEQGDYAKCYDDYCSFLRDKKPFGRVASASIELTIGQAAYYIGKTKKARKHLAAYLGAYAKLHDAPVECAEDYTYFLMNTFDEPKRVLALAFLTCIELMSGDWKASKQAFSQIAWADVPSEVAEELAKAILINAVRREYDVYWEEIIRTFWGRKALRQIVQQQLIALSEREEDREPYEHLVRAVAETEGLRPEPLDVRIVWDDLCGVRERMPEYFRRLFAATNPLLMDSRLWEIGLRRGAVLDERIAEIPLDRWRACVDEAVRDMSVEHLHRMAELLDEAFLGLANERYDYFMYKASDRFREAEAAEEARRQKEASKAAQEEMKQIITQLEQKVDDLVAAGMLDEADMVLKEIEKYTT